MKSMNQSNRLIRPVWCDAFLDEGGNLIFPIKVSVNTMKGWILERTGISAWLFIECQRFAGSLNEALALLMGTPTGGITAMVLQHGFERWDTWTDSERKEWFLFLLSAMEVEERRLLMSLLSGRSSATLISKYGLGKISSLRDIKETTSITVNAILLYVRPIDRMNTQYELTFGLYKEEGYTSCLRAILGEDGMGGWLQGLDDEPVLLDWITDNLGERIGPIRSVTVSEVFELQCDGIELSKRHKAGFKAESVRVLKWLRNAENAIAPLTAGNQSMVTSLEWVRDFLPKPQDSGQTG